MSILVYNPYTETVHRRNNFRFSNNYCTPETDIYESKNEIVVKMNLPGVLKDNISIEATFNELEIKTETSKQVTEESSVEQETSEKSDDESKLTPRHIERYERNYYRKFKFNKPIDNQQAKVVLQDGVLTVTLPLRPEAQKINLQIA